MHKPDHHWIEECILKFLKPHLPGTNHTHQISLPSTQTHPLILTLACSSLACCSLVAEDLHGRYLVFLFFSGFLEAAVQTTSLVLGETWSNTCHITHNVHKLYKKILNTHFHHCGSSHLTGQTQMVSWYTNVYYTLMRKEIWLVHKPGNNSQYSTPVSHGKEYVCA